MCRNTGPRQNLLCKNLNRTIMGRKKTKLKIRQICYVRRFIPSGFCHSGFLRAFVELSAYIRI